MKQRRYAVDVQGLAQPIRIAHVSDLHEHAYEEVLAALEKEKPDVILCTGDMLERHTRNGQRRLKRRKIEKPHHILYWFISKEGLPDGGMRFFQRCVAIAPTFYSLGNHEKYIQEEDRARLRQWGVRIVDNSDLEMDWKGRPIRIGGLSTKADWNWCAAFSRKPGVKILMVHHPEYVAGRILSDAEIGSLDLILSGHAHGGQCRLFDWGLFAPGQGLFPPYTRGMRKTNKGHWLISAGLSNTVKLPRFNNPKELLFVTLMPK